MDMDRRSFLKSIGLGAVALTVPKPLSVVAAKMADLERPPLHVGYAEAIPAKQCGEGGFFLLYDIGVRVERGLSASQHADYGENWSISMFLRKVGDKTRGIKYLQMPTCHMPDPTHKWTTIGDDLKRHERPAMLSSPTPYLFKPDDALEFWFSPHSARYDTEPPNHPLPKLEVVLHGVRHYKEDRKVRVPCTGVEYVGNPALLSTRSLIYWHLCEVKKVMLDRAKAIELGLVTDKEPTFYDFTTESR